eukprot:15364827-Ditylum_brightwellii.AAC.2
MMQSLGDWFEDADKASGCCCFVKYEQKENCWFNKAVVLPTCSAEPPTHYTQCMAWKAISGFLNGSLSFRPAGTITTLFESMCNMAGNIDIKKQKVLDQTCI